MAQVVADGYSSVSGSPFSNESVLIRRTYDFALDGGATADTYKLVDFPDGAAVRLVGVVCKTGVTSGGAATISVGLAGGTGAEMLSAEAITSFAAANDFAAGIAGAVGVVADDIELSIGTAALTAGKLELIFEYIAL